MEDKTRLTEHFIIALPQLLAKVSGVTLSEANLKEIGTILVLCLGWNVRLIVSLPRRYDVMTLRKPIVTWYVKTFRNVNYVC